MYYKTEKQCRDVIEALRERGIISPDNGDVHPEFDNNRGKWYISVVPKRERRKENGKHTGTGCHGERAF